MNVDDIGKDRDICEIQRRIECLRNNNQISISEKIAIVKKALEIIERDEVQRGVVQ